MRYQTVQDILEHAQSLHAAVADQAMAAAGEQNDPRLATILDYLAEHQTRLADAIASFRQDSKEATLATWYDRVPTEHPKGLDSETLVSARSTDDLIEQIVEFHEEVTELYGNLRDQAHTEGVRRVFADLANIEMHEKMELVQSSRQLDDI